VRIRRLAVSAKSRPNRGPVPSRPEACSALEVNEWIRTSGAFDGVIDFDKAMRDSGYPRRPLPAFDSGDHTHFNDVGYYVMGQPIDLSVFRHSCD
jgi:hypothetical protein